MKLSQQPSADYFIIWVFHEISPLHRLACSTAGGGKVFPPSSRQVKGYTDKGRTDDIKKRSHGHNETQNQK
jgi:hypothetical protein